MLVQCPTNYGRRNKFRQVMDQVEYFKTHGILVQKAHRLRDEGLPIPSDAILLGDMVRRDRPAMGVRR